MAKLIQKNIIFIQLKRYCCIVHYERIIKWSMNELKVSENSSVLIKLYLDTILLDSSENWNGKFSLKSWYYITLAWAPDKYFDTLWQWLWWQEYLQHSGSYFHKRRYKDNLENNKSLSCSLLLCDDQRLSMINQVHPVIKYWKKHQLIFHIFVPSYHVHTYP